MPSFLVVLDVDSTLIEEEAIELLAEEAGVVEEVREVTLRAMNGELDFEASLRERAATLAGLDADVMIRVRERVTLTRGVPEMTAGIRAAGGAVGAVFSLVGAAEDADDRPRRQVPQRLGFPFAAAVVDPR